MTSEVEKEFHDLLLQNDHESIVDLLRSFLGRPDLSGRQKGWALWNICDRLALLKKPDEQLVFQTRFFELATSTLPSDHMHWVVSDGTQAMSLVRSGHTDAWVQWYDQASRTANRTDENRGVRFESHRAFAYCFSHFKDPALADRSLTALESLLQEDRTWENLEFATCSYYALRLDYLKLVGDTDEMSKTVGLLSSHLQDWKINYDRTKVPSTSRVPPLGSWDKLNLVHPLSSVVAAMGNAACAFCRVGDYEKALHFFREAERRGYKRNRYSNTLCLIATWRTTEDSKLVATELHADPRLSPEHLKQLAPDLEEMFIE